ncbi:tryptophan--tRNA ligase [Herpetosiphon gulosus]|uniref:Tryptophan--tRNA ligase n=1 Tax=Herpetosiphon gulosus TaxID=1973496 RepID=A0ABP9X1N6_9CHLR
MSSLPRVFSGIQPSGNLHLGNYLGAIHTWVQEQNQYDNFFCIVDLHAITVPQDPAELRKNVRDLAALYLAAGISLEHATIFVQSHVPAHVELGWILNCQTPLGWLNRMTQFKDKSQKQETVAAGLMNYPTLMAADILLYDTQVVPVGDDQRQHIELTRDIAERFNHLYGETFVIPEALIRPVAARVMGLDDPTQKMSKSNKAANHSIPLLSDLKATRKAIMRAVTDSGSEIKFDETRPGVNNLLGIYQALTGKDKATIEAEFEGQGYGKLKGAVADVVIATLEPLQQRYNQLTADPAELDGILKRGAERAAEVANATLLRAYQQLGLR